MKRRPHQRRQSPRNQLALHEAIIVDQHRFMSLPGVQNVAVGMKEKNVAVRIAGKKAGGRTKEVHRRVTKRSCVKIYVVEKKPLDTLEHKPFPKFATILLPFGRNTYKVHRVPTDVVETKGFRLVGSADYFQDIPGGAQIGAGDNIQQGPGTQSCVVRRLNDGRFFLLTAAHVVATTAGPVPDGIMVFQPDITGQKFTVGRTMAGYRGNDPDTGVYLDVAIYAKENADRTATNATWDPHIPKLAGFLPLAQVCASHTATHKVGAATGYTTGLFSAFYPNFSDPQLGSFLNVLEFVAAPDSPGGILCDGGDSGSAMVSRSPGSSGAIIGILFAASLDGTRGLVVPFDFIRKKFGVEVA